MSRSKSHFPSVTSAGGLLPADFLLALKSGAGKQAGSTDIPGLTPTDYHLGSESIGEATNRAWNALQGRWADFATYLAEREDDDFTQAKTWDSFLRPLFRELGYGQLNRDLAVTVEEDTYKITHHWRDVAIHLLGAGISIDRRTKGVEGAAKKSPHAMVQEFLNRSDDHLWAFTSNGLRLRILRDNVSLTRQAYVEFDLYAMFEGGEYADFQLLWLLCHQSRVEGTPPETCWLEKWATEAKQRGVRMLDGLRDGVEKSISALGEGFLQHTDNAALRAALESGDLSTQDYYREVLRIVYRLIFLFVAEDRNLLLLPGEENTEARQRYTNHYATGRLREMAQRRQGSAHPDLWEQIKLIMDSLGKPKGEPALALPALGSFLWDAPRSTPHLAKVTLSNRYLLKALRALATVRTDKDKVRNVVDYRNLGAEELGSVYESLLELHPEINCDARTFSLDTSAGNDRKTSGSYYTPDSLVQCLLDTALEPVIKDRLAEARKANHANTAEDKVAAREQALLDLKVCDPAVGSGHFLIAAAHRISRHLARIRSGEEEPSPDDYQQALRDVVGRCLYGVDLNPMAVELCKVSLWIEAMEPGKPLSFLDHHIRCGNSLLGTTPALIAKGIPDGAYKGLTGDDKDACTFLRPRNKGEREGFGDLFVAEDTANLDALRSAAESVESIADDSITALQRKEQEYRKAESSDERLKQKHIADLWCAAFVWEKKVLEVNAEGAEGKCTKATGITTRHLQQLAKDSTLSGDQLGQLATDYQFFHWHVEFPGIFRAPRDGSDPDHEASGLSGGFDAMLGNPPWERVKLQEKEWFANRVPEIASASNAAARKRQIAALESEDPSLFASFQTDVRRAEGTSHVLRHSGLYPLCGRGDVNLYTVFAELFRLKLAPGGRFGAVLPSGIATDDTTKFYFRDLVEKRSLASFYDFENRNIFPEVHSSYKFCLLTAGSATEPIAEVADFSFFCHAVDDLKTSGRRFSLSKEDIKLLNPNTGTSPILRTADDLVLMLAVSRRVPPLTIEADESRNPWSFRYREVNHMAHGAGAFLSAEEYHASDTPDSYLPLYEAKLIHHFNHRWMSFDSTEIGSLRQDPTASISPRYYVTRQSVDDKVLPDWKQRWRIGWRSITRSTDERTLIFCIIPEAGMSNSMPLAIISNDNSWMLPAILSSFATDYDTRQRLPGANMTMNTLRQVRVLPSITSDNANSGHILGVANRRAILLRTLELTYTAWDLETFAQDCGYDGPPFRWDEERRFQLRCELDALFFHLYLPCNDASDWQPARIADGGVRDETDEELATLKSHFPTPRDAVAYIMETFPIVKRKDIARTEQKDADGNITREGTYITKDRILKIYDQMLEARRTRQPWQSPLDPPPGPPTDAEGNFLPMADWPAHPPHIHPSQSKN